MNRRNRLSLLLPLVLFLTLAMTLCSFAASKPAPPKLAAPDKHLKVERNAVYMLYDRHVLYSYLSDDTMAVTGTSGKVKLVSSRDPKGYFRLTGFYSKKKRRFYVTAEVDYAGLLEKDIDIGSSKFEIPAGVYPVSFILSDKGNKYRLTVKVEVKPYIDPSVSFLKVAGKVYRTPFSRRNSGLLYLTLPKNKRIKIGYGVVKGVIKCGIRVERASGNSIKTIRPNRYGYLTIKKGDLILLTYRRRGRTEKDAFQIVVK